MRIFIFPILFLLFNTQSVQAQWTHRYPRVDGYGHHVYLEGYELPVMNSGPMDPVPSPLNDQLIFSAKGWLWIMNLSTFEAKRITFSPHMDSRPNWSPDGTHVVFVRDEGDDTQIILLDIASGKEIILIDTEALDLDPIFAADGTSVYYASAKKGSIDLWKFDLATAHHQFITQKSSLERLPNPNSSGDLMIYLRKQGFSYDAIELLDLKSGVTTPLAEENFTSQAAFSLSPDDHTLAYTWPDGDDYELRLLDISMPMSNLLLTKSEGLPLAPKFSADGQWIYFAEYNESEQSEIKRIHINGGVTQKLLVRDWDWGVPMAKLKIITKVDGKEAAVRMSISDGSGHPIFPESGIVHSEGQHGVVFFYSAGVIEVTAPLGSMTITAVHGFSTEKQIKIVELTFGGLETEIDLIKIWDANSNGWYSGDNHFHLNYGGTSRLDPEDILLDLKGEDVDLAFPLAANLGNRFLGQDQWGWNHDQTPIIAFGQEVRSHFLGHVALLGIKELYWPWVWGPLYDIYGRDDRLNAAPLQFAREQGGLGGYVHPVAIQNPFKEGGSRALPIALIADAVLGEVDLIELVCLWSDEIGTAAVWHQLLSIGMPISPSAGSDVMNNLYRTMAIGAARVYVKPTGPLTSESYLEALKLGRSFVTNGPQMEFMVQGKGAGDVVLTTDKKTNWTLNVHSPISYEKVEIFLNGEVIWSKRSNDMPGSKTYKGSIQIPVGGWVTARVSGGNTEWPMMDSYPFAETGPIWFGEVGSSSTGAKIAAAKKLLEALIVSEKRLKAGYGENPIPNLINHFKKAKEKLVAMIELAEL